MDMGLNGNRRAEARFPLRLFLSYSHRDERYRKQLEPHLKLLQRRGVIACWDDRHIEAGGEWEHEILSKLESADIVLLLVSADFLASDYCYDIELSRALERHREGLALVIPVILRDVDWSDSRFGKLQPLPRGGKAVNLWYKRDSAWRDVSEGIKRAALAFLRNGSK